MTVHVDTLMHLIRSSKELAQSIAFDDNGTMIGKAYMGGNGGLISIETRVKADTLLRAISVIEQEIKDV